MNALGAVGSYFANNVVIVSEYFLDSIELEPFGFQLVEHCYFTGGFRVQ